MELRDYIEKGERITGSRAALCQALGLAHPSNLTNAKAGQRGLPLAACWKLAELISESRDAVTAASALITEKDEEVRNYLRPFVHAARHAQHLMIGALAVTTAAALVVENSISVTRSFLLKHRPLPSTAQISVTCS